MVQQLSGLSSQRGASVTNVILFIIVLSIVAKLVMAIVPAQIGDYQLTKILSAQLQDANRNGETATQLIERVNRQLSINADNDTGAEEVFTFTNKKAGQLAIYKKYEKTNNLYGNVDIVNRFEGDINPATVE